MDKVEVEGQFQTWKEKLMVTIGDIDRMIKKLIGNDSTGSRPFLCDGSPIGCEVFLIGLNPAVSTYWWDCWDPETGFDRDKWIRKFEKESIDEIKMKGRRTRLNIERLRNQILQYRVMDLNLYHKRSDNLPQLSQVDRKTAVCDYLIENIAPKLIFLHGDPTIEHLAELAGLKKGDLKIMEFTDVEVFGNSTTIFCGFFHLSRRWKNKLIEETGKRLLEWCKTNNLNKV